MTNRARLLVAAGALAVAGPLVIAFTGAAGQATAAPKCLATVTSNGSDPVCVGHSNGSGTTIGNANTPLGIYGINNTPGGSNPPVRPGTTWTSPAN